MYHDLNIPYSSHLDRSGLDKLRLILSKCTQQNEYTVALNVTMNHNQQVPTITPPDISTLDCKYSLNILKRVTIDTDAPLDANDIRGTYDLVALRTRNALVFEEACLRYDIDLITFHFDERISFELDPTVIQKALDRNIYFELCYADAIKDKQARTYTLQIARQLIEYTKGKQVIISSGADNVSEIRHPFDIFYFAKSLGLANDQAKFVIEKHCEQLLLKTKRKAIKS